MRWLDTNILIRYFTKDDPTKAQRCLELLRRVRQGAEEITTSETIIAEVTYVLTRHYNLSHSEIASLLRPVLSLKGLRLPNKRMLLRALDLFETHARLDFEDALGIAHMERLEVTDILSYDTDFDGIQGIRRVEP